MKIFATIMALFIVHISFSQTTEEEYNYVTKGYQIQLESGLDMKKGYLISGVGDPWGLDYGDFKRNIEFKLLLRAGEKIPCATIMKLQRTNTNYKEYLCIPHYKSSKAIWEKTYKRFRLAATDWTEASRAYSWGMIKMISYLNSHD